MSDDWMYNRWRAQRGRCTWNEHHPYGFSCVFFMHSCFGWCLKAGPTIKSNENSIIWLAISFDWPLLEIICFPHCHSERYCWSICFTRFTTFQSVHETIVSQSRECTKTSNRTHSEEIFNEKNLILLQINQHLQKYLHSNLNSFNDFDRRIVWMSPSISSHLNFEQWQPRRRTHIQKQTKVCLLPRFSYDNFYMCDRFLLFFSSVVCETHTV